MIQTFGKIHSNLNLYINALFIVSPYMVSRRLVYMFRRLVYGTSLGYAPRWRMTAGLKGVPPFLFYAAFCRPYTAPPLYFHRWAEVTSLHYIRSGNFRVTDAGVLAPRSEGQRAYIWSVWPWAGRMADVRRHDSQVYDRITMRLTYRTWTLYFHIN